MIAIANQPTPSTRQQLTRGLQTSIKHWIEVRDSLHRARVVIETASNLARRFPTSRTRLSQLQWSNTRTGSRVRKITWTWLFRCNPRPRSSRDR